MKKLAILIIIWAAISSPGLVFAQEGTYPQLDISGYKKWEYRDVRMDRNPQNYFSALSHLGGFYPTLTGSPWQERLRLQIVGQLSENLSVTYDLEQEPETPERFDVKVKYYNNELAFGDITANFSGNEFASTSKYLNGVMLTAKDGWYDIITVPSAKLKSQTQGLTAQKGTNSRGPYNLGHGSIVEGSERVELNGNPLSRNIDYTIDYFEGKITFERILTSADEFKYSYEYTNILDLFFPSLSKRDFFGFQSRFTLDPEEFGKSTPKPEQVILSHREVFPTAGTPEIEVQEREASGLYKLGNVPVINFSERLTFRGQELKKNVDYIIRYAEGEIKLLYSILPSEEEPLIIEYLSSLTSGESETILGIDSRGPYKLTFGNIIPESEIIEVDGKLFIRNLDYAINYEKGEIIFGINISNTSQIKAVYQHKVLQLPAVQESKFPKELKVGTTYLRESAKAGAISNTDTAIESFSGSSIKSQNYHIYLQNKPVISTGESFKVIVKANGVTLTPEVDYTFPKKELDTATGFYKTTPEATLAYINDKQDPSDGYYTGTIKFLNNSLLDASTEVVVTVTYHYYKNITGRYSGVGDSTRGPYYLRNARNIVPGTEIIQVWEQGSSQLVTYVRNSSFEANAGDNGYTINYNADNPYILFNKEIEVTKNFQIIYQYVPPEGLASQDISQSVFGFDGSFKIGDVFKIEGAYAKSETDQLISRLPTSESFDGNGSKTYYLTSPEQIIEASEKVYVNENLLNKDIDYYFSYAKPGQITFYYITPTTQDAIRVDYDYQSSAAAGGDVKLKSDYAYKIGGETKLLNDTLTISGATKKIGYDFTPMGGTAIGLGSEYEEYNARLAPDYHDLSLSYSYKENHNPIGIYREYYTKTYDNSVSSSINPNGLVLINLSYRHYESLDDLLPGATSHNSDSQQESYSLGLTPAEWQRGIITYNQKYDLGKTISESDIKRDSQSYSESTIDNWHAKGDLKVTDRVSLGYDYQASEPQTISLKSSTLEATHEALSSRTQSLYRSYNMSFDLTPGFLSKWTARANFLNHDAVTLVRNFEPTREVITTRNETYHMDLIPVAQINTAWDHNRQERTTLVIDGTNPKSERTAGSIKYYPLSWLTTGWSGSWSESIPETGRRYRTTGNSNTYNVDWATYSHERFKLNSHYTKADNLQTAPSGTFEGIKTETNRFSQSYTINTTPLPMLPLTLGYTLEDYYNRNNHPVADSRIDTKTQNETKTVGLNINLIERITLDSTYDHKTTRIIKDLKLSPERREKIVLTTRVTYQIYSWGSLVYERQTEDNKGEIQAGQVADLDLFKASDTYSLNISLPVDNPVLSSFIFTASMKTVDYVDHQDHANDFLATRTTFEGTLNF